mmetsp:Transcript_10679/g.23364  ORF Transcript_10679/g.23364 Transcript_10679/m.23364 type:complete len:286 (+) Transcript_10679:149-1006(+)
MAHTLFYASLWMFCSVSMILFNKAILSSYDFPFPMFLTTWHMLSATVLTQILAAKTDLLPGVKENKVDLGVLLRQILPVAACFAASLVCSNHAYIYLSVSYIQMLKACTPVVVLALSVAAGIHRTSVVEVNIVLLICIGVIITSMGELRFSTIGFVFQCLGVFFESCRLTLTGLFLQNLSLDALSTLYYIGGRFTLRPHSAVGFYRHHDAQRLCGFFSQCGHGFAHQALLPADSDAGRHYKGCAFGFPKSSHLWCPGFGTSVCRLCCVPFVPQSAQGIQEKPNRG